MLPHDNAPAHSAISVRQFLAQKMIAVLDHPPYFLDLAPADFFLFPRLKAAIKCAVFVDVNIHERSVTAVLRSIPQEAFADCFRKQYERFQTCAVAWRQFLRTITESVPSGLYPSGVKEIEGYMVGFSAERY